MNAVIIGASGFIGSALAAHLTRQGHKVLGLDITHPRSPFPAEAEFRLTDIRSDDFHLNGTVDGVFYLAQSSNYRAGDSKQLFEVNTHGGIRAFFAAQEAGASFFFYASTGNVYVPAFSPLAETTPVRRDQPYALSKLAVEDWLAIAGCQMKATSARLFGVFGPQQQAMLPAILRRKLASGEPVQLDRQYLCRHRQRRAEFPSVFWMMPYEPSKPWPIERSRIKQCRRSSISEAMSRSAYATFLKQWERLWGGHRDSNCQRISGLSI